MIRIIGMTTENKLETVHSFQEVNVDMWKWIWIDLENPSINETETLMNTFHLPRMSVKHDVASVRRPKVEHFTAYDFYITHILGVQNNELIKYELDFFIGEKVFVTIHYEPLEMINDAKTFIHEAREVDNWTTYDIFLHLLTNIVDSYYPLIEKVEDILETIEDNTSNKKMNRLMVELFDIRKLLLHMSYTIIPMKDMVQHILYSDIPLSKTYKRNNFTHVHDHLLKLTEMVTTNREMTADIRDNYLSLNSYETNNLMTVLTIVASIFTPLTFISGVYGMNFDHMPELHWKNGYYIVLIIMLLIATGMFIWFKRKGWFK